MDKLALKPCPHCGGTAEFGWSCTSSRAGGEIKISCSGCKILYTQRHLRVDTKTLREAMAETWNRRAPEPIEHTDSNGMKFYCNCMEYSHSAECVRSRESLKTAGVA